MTDSPRHRRPHRGKKNDLKHGFSARHLPPRDATHLRAHKFNALYEEIAFLRYQLHTLLADPCSTEEYLNCLRLTTLTLHTLKSLVCTQVYCPSEKLRHKDEDVPIVLKRAFEGALEDIRSGKADILKSRKLFPPAAGTPASPVPATLHPAPRLSTPLPASEEVDFEYLPDPPDAFLPP